MSGLWSEEEIALSGTGSERVQVASVANRKPPASAWRREIGCRGPSARCQTVEAEHIMREGI